MNQLILDEINKLKPSRPIFKIEVGAGWRGEKQISFTHESDFMAKNKPDNNPISELVVSNFSERYNNGNYTVNKEDIHVKVINNMRKDIENLIVQKMKQKFPLETKLGIFYTKRLQWSSISELETALIKVWKYIKENEGDAKHEQNALQILQMLYNKYEHRFPPPQKQTRRRRRR